jgi:membrane protein implicated in regulation of membrane protease activity
MKCYKINSNIINLLVVIYMEPDIIYWLSMFVVFAVIESITLSLVTIWFAVGSIAAFLAAWFGADTYIQVWIFIIVSVIVLCIFRPFAKKQLKAGLEPTNIDSLKGRVCLVREEIDNINNKGLVAVNDLEWNARTEEQMVIPPGDRVEIIRVEGVKLIVKPADPQE